MWVDGRPPSDWRRPTTARQIHRRTSESVAALTKLGRYADGAGLYLQVGPTGTKSWLLRYMRAGKAREMGLGPLTTVTLAEARKRARQQKLKLLDGIDPIAEREAKRQAERLDAARSITFDQCASEFIKSHRKSCKNDKHAEQWQNTLNTYCSPVFGSLPDQSVDTALVSKVLRPMWDAKTETASRVRGGIEKVLDWAKVHGYRDGENPARRRGHLERLLPQRKKVQKVEHFATRPYAQIGEFIETVRAQEGNAARAAETGHPDGPPHQRSD